MVQRAPSEEESRLAEASSKTDLPHQATNIFYRDDWSYDDDYDDWSDDYDYYYCYGQMHAGDAQRGSESVRKRGEEQWTELLVMSMSLCVRGGSGMGAARAWT